MSKGFRRRSGIRALRSAALLLLGLGASACYGFTGGGGFPEHIRTIYIAPFENETSQFELEQQLFAMLVDRLPGQLGVRLSGEGSADAVLRGAVVRYRDEAQNIRASDAARIDNPQVLAHEVQVAISAEFIDVTRNLILWDASGMIGRGLYNPESQNDQLAQTEAIEDIVEQILNAAQSQW